MTLLDAFSDFEEFRADNHRYPSLHLVFIAVCMILCGADDWKMVSKLRKRKRSWLKQYIPLPHRVPSHHTCIRVFAVFDPEQFSERFIKWINSIVERTHGEVVALDGKTLRRSYDKRMIKRLFIVEVCGCTDWSSTSSRTRKDIDLHNAYGQCLDQ